MQMKDYFSIQWKKPALDEKELMRENRKKALNDSFEAVYSRLESIEILNSNSKPEDVVILLNHLLVDLFNIPATFYDVRNIQSSSQISDAIEQLPEEAIRSLFHARTRYMSISALSNPTEEDAELLEEEASNLLVALEKHFKMVRKSQLHTSLDDYKKRWAIQGSILISILTLSIGSVVYNKIKYPVMKDDNAQVYFLTKDSPNPREEFSAKLPILVADKGVWKDYRFELPAGASELIGVRVDPINQRKIRFGLSHIRYLNTEGKVVFERDFKLTEALVPKDIEQIGMLNDLKAGKAVVGGFAEMVSVGSDPFFHLNLPITKNVRSVEVRMRLTEEYIPFKE